MARKAMVLLCAVLLCQCLAGAGAVESAPDAPAAPAASAPVAPAPASAEAAADREHKAEHPAAEAPRGPVPASEPQEPWVSAEQLAMAVGVVVTLGCMAGGWFLINQGGPKKRRFKGDAVFLVGPCDSGKSAAMLQLRDGDSGEKLPPTHTSQTFNEDFVDGVRVIDFPGHARLRPQLFDMIEDCAALVFVIDSVTFKDTARETASFVLDLLTSEKMLKHCTRMLVMCNKTDALPDELAGISPKTMVKRRLETEIDALRLARSEALDDIANSQRVELEIAGKVLCTPPTPSRLADIWQAIMSSARHWCNRTDRVGVCLSQAFKWTDAPIDVEFADASVALGTLDPVRAFVVGG